MGRIGRCAHGNSTSNHRTARARKASPEARPRRVVPAPIAAGEAPRSACSRCRSIRSSPTSAPPCARLRAWCSRRPPGRRARRRAYRAPCSTRASPERGEILVLEPRRLAARLSARRVAEELGERVGETVGLHDALRGGVEPGHARPLRDRGRADAAAPRRSRAPGRERRCARRVPRAAPRRRRRPRAAAAPAARRAARSPPRGDVRDARRRADRGVPRWAGGAARPAAEAGRGHDATAAGAPMAPTLRAEGRMFDVAIEHLPSARVSASIHAAGDRRAPAHWGDRTLDSLVASSVRQLIEERLDGDVLVFLPGSAEISAGDGRVRSHREERGPAAPAAPRLPVRGGAGPRGAPRGSAQDHPLDQRGRDLRDHRRRRRGRRQRPRARGRARAVVWACRRSASRPSPAPPRRSARGAPGARGPAAACGSTRAGDLASRPEHEAPEIRRARTSRRRCSSSAPRGSRDLEGSGGWRRRPPPGSPRPRRCSCGSAPSTRGGA